MRMDLDRVRAVTAQADRPNPFTTAAWRGDSSVHWLREADALEAMLAPVLEPLLRHAAISPGERILDVGSGRGATSLAAAELAGPTGFVTAADVSPVLVEACRQLVPAAGSASIDWLVADAQRAELGPGRFDVVISRFGVMFFDDPVAAFSNLATATRVGGRLAVSTWRPRDQSPFGSAVGTSMDAALVEAGYSVESTDPAGGPFSFGVDSFVIDVLTRAGWSDVALTEYTLPLLFGGPGISAEEAAELAMGMPGYQLAMARYDERASEIAGRAVLDLFRTLHDGSGVPLEAAVVVVTAQR
jgi:SAM-dependent methyltransferase